MTNGIRNRFKVYYTGCRTRQEIHDLVYRVFTLDEVPQVDVSFCYLPPGNPFYYAWRHFCICMTLAEGHAERPSDVRTSRYIVVDGDDVHILDVNAQELERRTVA